MLGIIVTYAIIVFQMINPANDADKETCSRLQQNIGIVDGNIASKHT